MGDPEGQSGGEPISVDPSSNDSPVASGGAIREIASGFRLLFEGMALLRKQRSLWLLSAAPVALASAALVIASGWVVRHATWLHQNVTAWMPHVEAQRWFEWLWVGPAQAGLALLGGAVFVAAAGLIIVAAVLLANLLSSPVLDLLSQKVERIVSGDVESAAGEGAAEALREAARAALGELQRLVFLAGIWAVCALVGLLPGGQLVAGPVMIAATILFLPLAFSGYTLDRRQVPFPLRRVWIRANFFAMVGFGSAGFAVGLVPGLNLLLIPSLVAGGTLLALRRPPPVPLPRPS